eukprot:6481985-Amphidinium_carterae.1
MATQCSTLFVAQGDCAYCSTGRKLKTVGWYVLIACLSHNRIGGASDFCSHQPIFLQGGCERWKGESIRSASLDCPEEKFQSTDWNSHRAPASVSCMKKLRTKTPLRTTQ